MLLLILILMIEAVDELSWIVNSIEKVPDANAFGLERDKDVVKADTGVRIPYSAPASLWYR